MLAPCQPLSRAEIMTTVIAAFIQVLLQVRQLHRELGSRCPLWSPHQACEVDPAIGSV